MAGCILLIMMGCSNTAPGPVVDNQQLETELASGELVMLKFGAKWCGPCRMVDQELGALAEKQPQLKIIPVDVDTNQGLVRQYKVQGIPNMVLVRNNEILARQVGYMSADELSSWIDAFSAQATPDAS